VPSRGRQGVRLYLRIAALVAAMLAALHTQATEYPARVIYFVVPSHQGSVGDYVGRLLALRLSEAFNQPVGVENRPGMNGVAGADVVARAAPDGYTLLQGIEALVINPYIYKVSHDPFRDFTPVSLTTRDPVAIAVHPSVPARSLAQLVDYARANPGRLNIGTSSRVFGELFKQVTGIDGEIIPYRVSPHAVNDVMKGVVHVAVASLNSFMPYSRSDRLRLLAVAGGSRHPAMPLLPAAGEILPGYEGTGWTSVLGPAALPMGVVSRLNTEIMKVLHVPAMHERLEQVGSIPVGSSPRELSDWMRTTSEQWRRVAQVAGMKGD
jgi:tripartite-type tricarboxylate transporter receptor subunit TctC